MRLLMHNMLVCNVRACRETAHSQKPCKSSNYPLIILPTDEESIVVADTVYSKAFMTHILKSIDYEALCQTTKELRHPDIPVLTSPLPSDYAEQDLLLQRIHRVLFDVHVEQGELRCRHCERSYPIVDAVVDMMLQEDEL